MQSANNYILPVNELCTNNIVNVVFHVEFYV